MTQSAHRPNLVLIFSDQQHWQAVGYKDNTFNSPHLDSLARQSVIFDHAFCTTPQCSPARSSLLTGFYPSQTGVMGNVGSAGGGALAMPTLAPRLKKLGYHTGYLGKWHLGKDPAGVAGWDCDLGVRGIAAHKPESITEAALEYLGDRREGPFALVISYHEPHGIYDFKRKNQGPGDPPMALPHSWHHESFSGKPAAQKQFMTHDQGRVIWDQEAQVWSSYRAYYRQEVSVFDAQVGQLLAKLRELNQEENTLVVVTSDHGDMDAHHRLVFKGPFMYEQMVRVPLLVRPPASLGSLAKPGRRVHDLVTHPDVTALLMDYAGDVHPVGCGKSLRPFLNGGPSSWRQEVVSQYYGKQQWVNPIRMIRNHQAKYTLYRTDEEEL